MAGSQEENRVHKFLANDYGFRAAVVDATPVVRHLQTLQHTYPIATMAMGRSVVATALMASQLKEGQMVSVYFRGNGPLEMIFAEANFEGEVRGYTPNPQLELPLKEGRLDLKNAIGIGLLTVVRSVPYQQTPHRGTVDIQTGEIGDDIAYYLHQSHQVRSVMAVGVKVNPYGYVQSAGGVYIELMPDAHEGLIEQLEERVAKAGSISEKLDQGASVEDIKNIYLGGMDVHEIEHPYPLRYQCKCSKERFERSLLLLGTDEIQRMISQGEAAEARCEFCGQDYQLSAADLKQLMKKTNSKSSH